MAETRFYTSAKINDSLIDDITSMPDGIIKTKVNVIVDFSSASQSIFSMGKREKIIAPILFNDSAMVSATQKGIHVNLIDSNALSEDQKQNLLDHNALPLSDDDMAKDICFLPQGIVDRTLSTIREKTRGADTVHVLGDISGLDIVLERSKALFIQNADAVNLADHKSYPFTQKQGHTDFIFWGDNNQEEQEATLEQEKRQGIISKTIDLNQHNLENLVILSAHNPISSYDID